MHFLLKKWQLLWPQLHIADWVMHHILCLVRHFPLEDEKNVTLLKPVFYSFSPIITINRFYIQACRNNLPPFTFAHPWMCFIFTEWITLCLNRWAVYWKTCVSRCGLLEPRLHGSTVPAEGSVWTRLRFLWGISAVWMFPAVVEGINRLPPSLPPVRAAPAAPGAGFPSGMGSCIGELLWLMFDCSVHLFICLANKWIINGLPPCFPSWCALRFFRSFAIQV